MRLGLLVLTGGRSTLRVGLGVLAVAGSLAASAPARALERAEVDTESRGTVAVCDDRGGGAGTCGLECTGVLLAPRVVLTARHCVTGRASSMPSCGEDVEGPLLEPASRFAVATDVEIGTSTAWMPVTRIDVPPAVAPCGHDLALLTLRAPLSAAIAAIHVEGDARDFTLTGYGATNAAGAGAGVRRTANARLGCRSGQEACRAFAGGTLLAAGELLVEARACSGDSGGAAFSPLGVVAVLSRSLESDGACGVPVYTAVDRHLLWLARTVRTTAEADGTPLPSWVAAAERRGNGPGRGPGANCSDDRDCDSGLCRSRDGDRTFVCALACGGDCACESTSRGPACFGAERDDGGCRAASSQAGENASDLAFNWLALVALLAYVTYLRTKSAPFGPKRPGT